MAEQAQVKSVEALESLRAAFLMYQAKSRRSVDMALEEVARTRQWIQVDRRTHWEGQIRYWTRLLERARSELMTVRLSALVDRSTRHEEAVRTCERGLAHAQEKVKAVKRWTREYDTAIGPHVRRLESVREHLMHELPKATAWLHQAQITLDAYAESQYASLSGPALTDAAVDAALPVSPESSSSTPPESPP